MTATDKAGSDALVSVGQKRLVIVGASGMVGGYALRHVLNTSTVERVTSIGRKTLGISHPKLKEVLHQNFADCSALADALLGQDAAVYCLGTYTGSVSDAELRAITADRTLQGRGREGVTRSRFPARLSFPARVHLPCAVATGTEFQLPADTRVLSCVSIAVSEPGHSR